MSDTPTLANLLARWRAGDPPERQAVYAHLRAHPAEAAAAEAFVRDELRAVLPLRRVIAAEAVAAVYDDQEAAAAALGWVLKSGEPAAVAVTGAVLPALAPGRAAALCADFARETPTGLAALPQNFHRLAGAALTTTPGEWLRVFEAAGPGAEAGLLAGLAEAAPRASADLAALVPAATDRLFRPGSGYAAGAALWRITWRVRRDWLDTVVAHDPQFENDPARLVLVITVLGEHLGRRPDLAPRVRELLTRLAADEPAAFGPPVERLARLGGCGWAVLLPLLGGAGVPAAARAAVFRLAARHPAAGPLARPYAHGAILARARDRESVPPEVLEAAAGLLSALGRAAESAVPDLLDLMVKQPDAAPALAAAVAGTGFRRPDAAAVLTRTLDRLRRAVAFDAVAFAALANLLAGVGLDAATALVDDTSFDSRTAEGLLQEGPWKDAAPEARVRHARLLVGRLGAPRAEVRARAAACLHHYPDQLPGVWPALVAGLLGGDAEGRAVLPLFAALGPAADAVAADLDALLAEPNPAHAGRAAVALLRLGRLPADTAARCAEVLEDASGAWDWCVPPDVPGAVVRAAEQRVALAARRDEVVAAADALLFAPYSIEEEAISAHVRLSVAIDWNGLYSRTSGDPECPLLLLALVSAGGAAGFPHKITLIKHQRGLTGLGLVDSKAVVDRALDTLGPKTPPAARRRCVRDYFGRPDTPAALAELVAHRVSWYRWAGLELLDAWGAGTGADELIAGRRRDRSERVRLRALRIR